MSDEDYFMKSQSEPPKVTTGTSRARPGQLALPEALRISVPMHHSRDGTVRARRDRAGHPAAWGGSMKSRGTFLLLLSFVLLFTHPTTMSAAGIIRGKVSALGSPGLPKVKVVAYDYDYNDLREVEHANATGDCEGGLFYLPCDGDKHDRMCQDITDVNGNDLIRYYPPNRPELDYPGHWDKSSVFGEDTRWRPDIFIEVYISTDGFCEPPPLKTETNKWRFAGRSQIFVDHRTDTPLTNNVTVLEIFDLSCGPFAPLAPYLTPYTNGELRGWVDMHAHPMAHLAFGGHLLHGAPDVGARMAPGTRYCGQNKIEYADG